MDPAGFRVDRRFEPDDRQPGDRNPWHDSQCPGSGPQRPGNRPGVSASTFKDLGWGYGKDAFSVWYCGQEIKGAVSGRFRVLGDGYAEDGFNTYYYGKKVR
ncbi:MAG: DKNYY domain-containing protein [Bacteroidales bacterium]|nr:DKNYY domain-containing protein [Bacteroidales bacterium]MDE6147331.1 DKNYY domain-containing protein [Bacteroidales bacterium]